MDIATPIPFISIATADDSNPDHDFFIRNENGEIVGLTARIGDETYMIPLERTE